MRALARAAARVLAKVEERTAQGGAAMPVSPLGVPLGGWPDARAALIEAVEGALSGDTLDELETSLEGLTAMTALSPLDAELFALAILPNLDDRIARAVGLLHDDLSRTRISAGLACRLLARDASHTAVLSACAPGGELAHRGFVELVGAYGDRRAPLSNQELAVHPRVLQTLLWSGPAQEVDPAFAAGLTLGDPLTRGELDEFGDLAERLGELRDVDPSVGLQIVSPTIDPALAVASAFATAAGTNLLRVHVRALLALGLPPGELDRLVRRESALCNAFPVWLDLPDQEMLQDAAGERALALAYYQSPRPLVMHATKSWVPPSDTPLVLIVHSCPTDAISIRARAWMENGVPWHLPARSDAEVLASAYRLTRDQVVAARRGAFATQLLLGGSEARHVGMEAQKHASAGLVRFADRMVPDARWEDLVLPPAVLAQLHEIQWRVAHRDRVAELAGFSRAIARRQGFVVLFAGPSGTGKSLSAEVVTGSGYLFRVDLSSLFSKFIGETEKHLSRLFDDAESTSGSILFFDEADAVFGKRSEVKDAHDRYANLEINYLLQRIESYKGVVILATNLRQNIDAAFARRLDLVVEFPFPDPASRSEIWRRVLPKGVVVDPTLDLDALGTQFDIAGGSIRNCAVDATFRAAARGAVDGTLPLRRDDVMLALAREYQKLGRPVIRSDFGASYELAMRGVFGSGP